MWKQQSHSGADQTTVPRPSWRGGLGPLPNELWYSWIDEPMNGWSLHTCCIVYNFWFTCKKGSVKENRTKKIKINIVFGPDQSKWPSSVNTPLVTYLYSDHTLPFKSLGSVQFFKIHLLYCFLTDFYFYMIKCSMLLWRKAIFFSSISPVFRVTWSFKNHSNMMIFGSNVFLLLSMLKTYFFTTQKDRIYLKQKPFVAI